MAQALPHALMYTAGQHIHYDMSQYYTPAYAHFAPSAYPERTMKQDRRRPKYTRSKTGCLTCRKKKVKCDESHPKCQRCANSSLDCTWPDPPPPKKKTTVRKRVSNTDDASASEAGTSSLSPTATGDAEGTPQLPYVSAPVSPELGQAMQPPQLNYNNGNVNLLQAATDRRHSNPDVQINLSATAIAQSRRHSTQFTDHQRFGQPMSNGGALGLSLNHQHQGDASRPSTPNDFLYPHLHSQVTHAGQQATSALHGSAAYTGYSPNSSMNLLPNLSGSASSRPSTASSLSIAHSLSRRTSAGTASSRPSTAGSLSMPSSSTPLMRPFAQHQIQHRPGSASSVGGEVHHPLSYSHSPFSFNHSGNTANGVNCPQPGQAQPSFDANTVTAQLGGYSQPASRPGTANSGVMQTSPYMRQPSGGVPSVAAVGNDQWQASPMLGQSPLIAPHAQAPVNDTYFQMMSQNSPMVRSPATQPIVLSRAHSPSGNWN